MQGKTCKRAKTAWVSWGGAAAAVMLAPPSRSRRSSAAAAAPDCSLARVHQLGGGRLQPPRCLLAVPARRCGGGRARAVATLRAPSRSNTQPAALNPHPPPSSPPPQVWNKKYGCQLNTH